MNKQAGAINEVIENQNIKKRGGARPNAGAKMKQLIKGADLTSEQINMLPFSGKSNREWIACHSFYFIDGIPASKDSGFYYPVCNSLSFLPY